MATVERTSTFFMYFGQSQTPVIQVVQFLFSIQFFYCNVTTMANARLPEHGSLKVLDPGV